MWPTWTSSHTTPPPLRDLTKTTLHPLPKSMTILWYFLIISSSELSPRMLWNTYLPRCNSWSILRRSGILLRFLVVPTPQQLSIRFKKARIGLPTECWASVWMRFIHRSNWKQQCGPYKEKSLTRILHSQVQAVRPSRDSLIPIAEFILGIHAPRVTAYHHFLILLWEIFKCCKTHPEAMDLRACSLLVACSSCLGILSNIIPSQNPGASYHKALSSVGGFVM